MTTSSLGTVAITGASSGIGATYADRFAARGHGLVLIARRGDVLDALAARLRAAYGVAVRVVVADLTDPVALAAVEADLASDAGLTHLVNNAGVASVLPVAAMTPDQITAMVAINVTAPARLARAVVGGFKARGQGTLINLSSVVAVGPEILNGVYSGSKAFMLALSQSLRQELAGTGVHVQAVLPGATATDIWQTGGGDLSALPPDAVMSVDDLVDAALTGLDRGEFITIPPLAEEAEWTGYETARQAMLPNLSRREPAARYR